MFLAFSQNLAIALYDLNINHLHVQRKKIYVQHSKFPYISVLKPLFCVPHRRERSTLKKKPMNFL
ncbi:hypothetical protein HanRHA438_Chr10g0467811 [Helianthus annuus]|nr:hypothetical protein HanRHA438_Chr10g0467811 [Helianthus annuus]